jgi:hypothetical protein
MEEWLKNNGIFYDRINDNHPDKIKEYENNSRKIYADIYIDDKNILGIPSWKEIYTIISQKRSKKIGLLLESLYLRGIQKNV